MPRFSLSKTIEKKKVLRLNIYSQTLLGLQGILMMNDYITIFWLLLGNIFLGKIVIADEKLFVVLILMRHYLLYDFHFKACSQELC